MKKNEPKIKKRGLIWVLRQDLQDSNLGDDEGGISGKMAWPSKEHSSIDEDQLSPSPAWHPPLTGTKITQKMPVFHGLLFEPDGGLVWTWGRPQCPHSPRWMVGELLRVAQNLLPPSPLETRTHRDPHSRVHRWHTKTLSTVNKNIAGEQ